MPIACPRSLQSIVPPPTRPVNEFVPAGFANSGAWGAESRSSLQRADSGLPRTLYGSTRRMTPNNSALGRREALSGDQAVTRRRCETPCLLASPTDACVTECGHQRPHCWQQEFRSSDPDTCALTPNAGYAGRIGLGLRPPSFPRCWRIRLRDRSRRVRRTRSVSTRGCRSCWA